MPKGHNSWRGADPGTEPRQPDLTAPHLHLHTLTQKGPSLGKWFINHLPKSPRLVRWHLGSYQRKQKEGYKPLVASPILTKAAFLRPTLNYKESKGSEGEAGRPESNLGPWKSRVPSFFSNPLGPGKHMITGPECKWHGQMAWKSTHTHFLSLSLSSAMHPDRMIHEWSLAPGQPHPHIGHPGTSPWEHTPASSLDAVSVAVWPMAVGQCPMLQVHCL